MFISIFYALLLALQIVVLVKAVKKKQENYWSFLFITITLSIVLVIVYFCCGLSVSDNNRPFISFIENTGFGISAFIAYVIMLIVSSVIRISNDDETTKDEETKKNQELSMKKVGLGLLAIVASFVVAVCLQIVISRVVVASSPISKHAVAILNEKYGDGNFKVLKVTEKTADYVFLVSRGTEVYDLLIRTDYLENDFTLQLKKENLEVYKDDFLVQYYKENPGTKDFKSRPDSSQTGYS